jgi:uncharacterized protein
MADAARELPPPIPVIPWGYFATFGWAFLAFVLGQVAALAALLGWAHGDLRALFAQQYDGAVVTLSVLVLNPVTVAVLMLAVRVRSASLAEYLGLVWPRMRALSMRALSIVIVDIFIIIAVIGPLLMKMSRMRALSIGIVIIVVIDALLMKMPRMRALSIVIVGIFIIIAATDALLFVSGRAIVSPFQLVAYTTAAQEGWLPLMWLAIVIVAPAGEEIMFRGFLFRGWVSSQRSAWIAVPLISLLWTGLHVQYDWVYMPEIFVAGLFLGWVRWSSGSTLLTFLLHALLNLEGMLETVAQVRHVF